jgi:hypothetical protein
MAQIDEFERLEKATDRQAERERREGLDAEEKVVADWFADVQAIADGLMVQAGFHKHRGQWRRRRQ